MRKTRRFWSVLLTLALVTSLLGMGALAANAATISDATLTVPEVKAGAQVKSDFLSVPDGASYTVQVTQVRLLPFVGAEVGLVTGSSLTLEAGHIYAIDFTLKPQAGAALSDDLDLKLNETGALRHSQLTCATYSESEANGTITYDLGGAETPVTVTAAALTTDQSLTPAVGSPLASKVYLNTTPTGGVYVSKSTGADGSHALTWRTADANGSVYTPAAGETVTAGHPYYQVSFSFLPAEGYRFADDMTVTLNGAAVPAAMQSVLAARASQLAVFDYTFYGIEVLQTEHGTAAAPDYAAAGETVALAASPEEGYALSGWVVLDQDNSKITVSDDNTFVMPASAALAAGSGTVQTVRVVPVFTKDGAAKPVQYIDAVTITGATLSFQAGKSPVFTGKTPASAPYSLAGGYEMWSNASGTSVYSSDAYNATLDPSDLLRVFEGGKDYTYGLRLRLTEAAYTGNVEYRFAPNVKIVVNGTERKPAAIQVDETGETLTALGVLSLKVEQPVKPAPDPDPAPSPAPQPTNPFIDVKEGLYYYDAVLWAVNHTPQITNGTSANTFSPDATCTRGQVVTFLWRAAGCPAPASSANPFGDVKPGAYYYDAVLWAVEKGITKGTSNTTFSPDDPCTRAHVVTFLWRSEGEPRANSGNPFADVPAGQYYTDAVLWAVANKITNGTGPSTFSPGSPCTRGQIVTFLYRDKA